MCILLRLTKHVHVFTVWMLERQNGPDVWEMLRKNLLCTRFIFMISFSTRLNSSHS